MTRKASIKSKREIELLREGGNILVNALLAAAKVAKQAPERAVSTQELNDLADFFIRERGGEPSFYGYRSGIGEAGFPAAMCVSINDEIVHGIPKENRFLQDGDLLKMDLGVKYKNLFTDAAFTMPIGKVARKNLELMRATRRGLELGLKQIYPGSTLGDYGNAVEKYAGSKGFSVVTGLVGHGVGYAVHEPPQIPNYGRPGEGLVLKEGMVIALEPMLNEFGSDIDVGNDGFAFITKDGGMSAHFEITVAVTKNGHQVLTNWMDK
ncbi:MAG: type I methionyl aminopeptidase, partial [Candidatus Moranbacteria bacterium]|nr:type I methionyl aminopeptidase [Candidatus Moranbacteria bacterium]